MYTSDPEQPMESTGIDPQNCELKRFKVMTAVSVIAFVISISIASGFLVHQKNEHRDAIHERDESITELNQQLVQLKEEQNHRETELKEKLQQMEKERDEEKKSVESLTIDIGRAHKLKKQFKEEAARFTEERVTLKFEMERKKELWKNLNRNYIEKLADSMNSNVRVQKELLKVTEENALREQKSKHHDEEMKVLRQIIHQKEDEIGTVMEERDNLQREVKDLRDEIESIKIQPAHCDSALHHLHAPPTSDNALSEVGSMRVWVEQIRVGVQDLLLFKTLPADDRIIEVRYDDDVVPVAELTDHIRNWMISKIRDGHWTQVLTQFAEDVCFSPETLHSLLEDVVEENRIVISLLTERETNAAANGYGSGQYLENLKQKNVGIDEQEFGKMIEDMRITAQTLSQQNINIYIKILDDGSCIGALAQGDQEQDDDEAVRRLTGGADSSLTIEERREVASTILLPRIEPGEKQPVPSGSELHVLVTSDDGHPMTVMRLWVQQISFGFYDMFRSTPPTEDRIIEVPYPGYALSVTQLVDYIRNWLISKVRDGQWKQVLSGYDVCIQDVEQLHRMFENVVEDEHGERIFVSLLPRVVTTNVANGIRCSEELQHLQQQKVGIDQQEFDKMIANMRITAETMNYQGNMYICTQILS